MSDSTNQQAKGDDVVAVQTLGEARDTIVAELRKTSVGMDDVIDEMTIAIFARGHCLLVGVPEVSQDTAGQLTGPDDVAVLQTHSVHP